MSNADFNREVYGEDTPSWDERHDGYSVDRELTAAIMGGDDPMLRFTSALFGFKVTVNFAGDGDLVVVHGAPHTLEILEALHGVISESLARERKLQQG